MSSEKDILMIDDEQVILDAVNKIASAEGLKVDPVLNAEKALEKLSSNKYSLILCDIMMTGIDGFMFLEELNKKKIKTPVIMITGYSTVENAVKSLTNGAIDFIPKPFTFEEISSAINRGLKFSSLQKNITQGKNKSESVTYVPCPPKYKRLGNISWMNLESEGIAAVGATDLFLEIINDVLKIELMELEDEIVQGNVCARFETADSLVHNFLSPLSGRIIERNNKLSGNPKLLEKDPYFEGWLYKVIPSDVEFEEKYLVPCSSDRM